MAVDLAQIRKGMHVRSSDGEDLGRVAKVWIGTDPTHSGERCVLPIGGSPFPARGRWYNIPSAEKPAESHRPSRFRNSLRPAHERSSGVDSAGSRRV